MGQVIRGSNTGRSAKRGIRRSLRLLWAFRYERTRPEHFYALLAEDTCDLLEPYVELCGARILDVGGGPGYFGEAASARGAWVTTLDASSSELFLHGRRPTRAVVADAVSLPFGDAAFDVVHASNVLEHVSSQEELVRESLRVLRPGGVGFFSFTVWLSPWGGHETSPWHLLGGELAVRVYLKRHGTSPKNRYLVSLFPTYVGYVRRIVAASGAELLGAFPRYYPNWMEWVAEIPLLREFATWNYALVVSKR